MQENMRNRKRRRSGAEMTWWMAVAATMLLLPWMSAGEAQVPALPYQPPAQHAFALQNPPFANCSTNCVCTADQAVCQGGTIREVKLRPTTQRLILEGVKSDQLVKDTLRAKNLAYLSWRGGDLQRVSSDAFVQLQGLVHLDLSENSLSQLADHMFQGQDALKLLNLTTNQLSFLPQHVFQGLENLEILYLARNKFATLPYRAFEPLKELQTLDLSGNNFATLQDVLLPLHNKLVDLLISNSQIFEIKPNTFSTLQDLQVLDLSHNKLENVSDQLFVGLHDLRYLHLGNNRLEMLPARLFTDMERLLQLNLGSNPLQTLGGGVLTPCAHLESLYLNDTELRVLRDVDFKNLRSLKHLQLTNNKQLSEIDDYTLVHSPRMRYLDLRNNNLTQVPFSLISLHGLRELKVAGNPWACGCRSQWFVNWAQKLGNNIRMQPPLSHLKCFPAEDGDSNFATRVFEKNCTATRPEPQEETAQVQFRFGGPAKLECRFSGHPTPSITWLTPERKTYHWTPPDDPNEGSPLFWEHPRSHGAEMAPVMTGRVRVSPIGELLINRVLREDAGRYTCFASNALANATMTVIMKLDPVTMHHIQYFSLGTGGLCALTFLICTLIVQGIKKLVKRCAWCACCMRNCSCCCEDEEESISPRSKQVHQVLETIEQYKTLQLERLRDNYTEQVHRIKENCTQQVEWIRESYTGQIKHFKDFREFGTSQITSIRGQYYDQVKRVRDYSTNQLNWVRENYVFQRNRIKKFSVHQAFRLRETCKYQQQTLNKLLENLPSLNLENCRSGACGRTDSINFDSSTFGDDELRHVGVSTEWCRSRQSIYYTPTELLSPSVPPRPRYYIPPMDNAEMALRLQACLQKLQDDSLSDDDEDTIIVVAGEPQNSPYFSPPGPSYRELVHADENTTLLSVDDASIIVVGPRRQPEETPL